MAGYPTLIGREYIIISGLNSVRASRGLIILIGVHRKDMGRNAPLFLDLWMFLNLISNTILLPLLVMIFLFSKRARKPLPLINVCITWILSVLMFRLIPPCGANMHSRACFPYYCQSICFSEMSLASSNLRRFYVGGDKGNAKVSQELCITQSSLLYGIMPM